MKQDTLEKPSVGVIHRTLATSAGNRCTIGTTRDSGAYSRENDSHRGAKDGQTSLHHPGPREGGFLSKCLQTRLGTAENQGMDIMSALIGIDGLQVHDVADDVVLVGDAVPAMHIPCRPGDLQCLAA